MNTIDYIIVGVYMLVLIGIGVYAKGQIKTVDDFVLGGRRFGRLAMMGTILATMVGSGMTMGAVGNVYDNGVLGTTVYIYVGFAIGLFVFSFMVPKIRATGARSLSEVLSESFGVPTRLISAIVVIFYAIALVAINIAGLRTVIIYIFGNTIELSIPAATGIAALISIAYTALGGFFAVVWTDVVQLMIMIFGVFILGPIIGLDMTGGFGAVVSTYASEGLSITNPTLNGVSSGLIGIALSYGLCVPGDPTMPQRALAAKSDGVGKFSFGIAGFLALYFGIAVIIIGGSIHVLSPGLENSDAALLAFILTNYPPIIKGITVAGIIAAIMSSFDSFLILTTTHLVYDIGQVLNPNLDEKNISKLMPVVTIIIGVIGIIIALFITSLLGYLSMVFSIVGASLVPALVSALYFKEKVSKTAVCTSIVVGAVIPAYLFLTKGYDVFMGDPVFSGLIAAIIVLIVGSLVLKDKPNNKFALKEE